MLSFSRSKLIILGNTPTQSEATDTVFSQNTGANDPLSIGHCPTTLGQNIYLLCEQLVGALSPVNHKGLHQGWTQISLFLQVIHFTSHHTTSRVCSPYLYSAGTQHGNLHPAGWPTSFCRPTDTESDLDFSVGQCLCVSWEQRMLDSYHTEHTDQ